MNERRLKEVRSTLRTLYAALKICEEHGQEELFEQILDNNAQTFYKLIYEPIILRTKEIIK